MKFKISFYGLLCALIFSMVYYMAYDTRPTGLVDANKMALNYIGLIFAFLLEQFLYNFNLQKESIINYYYITLYVCGFLFWYFIGWGVSEVATRCWNSHKEKNIRKLTIKQKEKTETEDII